VSGGAIDELGGSGASGGGAVKSSEVDVAGKVVVVAVDVADDGCDAAIDACDAGCDDTTGGKVSVEETVGLGSEVHWNEVGVGTLGVVAFFGHIASNASEKTSQDSFFSSGRALHHMSASEHDFRCSSKAWSLSASVTSALGRSHCSILCRKSCGSSCS
jgi:hypothetical protein